jgi:hypothetical protein
VAGQSAQRGRLEGVVRDTGGEPLPGVTVTVTSPALQGQRRTATEAGGGYVLRDLPRGDYAVRFEFPGLQSVEQAVVIELGRTSRAEAVMDLAQFEEAVVVEAATPAALDTPQGGSNFTLEQIDAQAIDRNPQDIAKLAAGVNESPVYAEQVRISGAYAYDNAFLVEGHDVADIYGAPVQGVTTLTGPYIEDAIEETQVATSTISAEFGRFGGGVVNMVTKSGGNDFAGTFRVDVFDPTWRDETPYENRVGAKREGRRAEVLSATLGGPILEDRLWFFVAGRRNDDSQPGTMAISGAPSPNEFLETRYQVKLTGNLGDNHSLQGTWVDTDMDGLVAFPWIIDPNAVQTQINSNSLLVLRYSGVVGRNLHVEGQVSQHEYAFEGGGISDRDPSDLSNSPFESWDGWLYNHPNGDPQDPDITESERLALSVAWFGSSPRAGSHDLKLGVERFEEENTWGGRWSRTGWYMLADFLSDQTGAPIYDARNRFQPLFAPGDVLALEPLAVLGARVGFETTSVFLNDRWLLNEHWSFNLGVRYESVSGYGTPGVDTADAAVVAPRLAASLDPKGDGRFRLGLSYGEYPGKHSVVQFDAFTDNAGRGRVDYLYVGPPGVGLDFAPGFDRANYVPVWATTREGNLLAPGTSSAINQEWTVSAGMRLPRGGYVEAVLVDRELTNILEDFVTLDNGTTTLELPDLTIVTDNTLLRNTKLAKRTYRALHLQGRYRLTDTWTLDGTWTWQLKNDGNSDGGGPGSFIWNREALGDYPEILPQERIAPGGRLADYQEHQIRLWTNYFWSLGRAGDVNLGLLYRYDSPRTYSLVARMPVTDTQLANDPGYAAPPFSQDAFFGRRGSQEFEASHVFDLAVRYEIGSWKAVEPWIKLDVRNLLNEDAAIEWNRTVFPDFDGPVDEHGIPTQYIEGPQYGETQAAEHHVIPREYRFSFGLRF